MLYYIFGIYIISILMVPMNDHDIYSKKGLGGDEEEGESIASYILA